MVGEVTGTDSIIVIDQRPGSSGDSGVQVERLWIEKD